MITGVKISEKATMWKCPKCGREFKKKEQSHYCGEKPKNIDEYILRQEEDKQEALCYMRNILQKALPEAEERISWSMPTYWKKHNIIQFCRFQKSYRIVSWIRSGCSVCRRAGDIQDQ